MRATLGAGLLLVSTSLVGIVATPAEAATGCENPDTTWVGPATEGGSVSWDETANWTNGVPTAASVVCIPAAALGPHVLEGTAAEAGAVTLEGALAVAGSLDVATLEGDLGELHGPGTTTVTERLSGTWLTLEDSAVVDLREQAALGGELHVYDGSKLNVRGDTALEPGARIDSLSDNPGLFTIAKDASLTFDSSNESARVIGGFANHGTVTVTVGYVLMMGADTADAHGAQFSTGTFTGAPDATFSVSNTELRDGARLEHVWVDHITVPAGDSVTLADSQLHYLAPTDRSLAGGGEVVVTGNSSLGGRIGGALSVTVADGAVMEMGEAIVEDQARIRVDGELRSEELDLNDDAVLDIYGVHKGFAGGTHVDFSGTDPGLEIIRPSGQLLSDDDGGVIITAPFVNQGTVHSRNLIYLGPRSVSPSPSHGTFRADPAGGLYLGSDVDGDPELALNDAVIEGDVDVSGPVFATNTEVRGGLSTLPRGRLALEGETRMTDGSSIAGDVTVAGDLDADLSPTGTASLSNAEVTAEVWVHAGTLSVPSLAPTTLTETGTLTQGRWFASRGATLDLPAVRTNDTWLGLDGPGASFGDGLATLTRNGPNGNLVLGGDLSVRGRFRNEGVLALAPRSRLDVGGEFRQLATGTLMTRLDSTGRGRISAAGPRELAGELWVERDPAYKPPIGTVLPFITSAGATGPDDAFDMVVSPKYGTRKKINPIYGVNRVRLRVDRVG